MSEEELADGVSANDVEEALDSVGVKLRDVSGQFRDFDDVLLDLSKIWDTLSTNQQKYIATTAAGSRQQSRFIALVSGYQRNLELIDIANNSAGASTQQFATQLTGLEASFNRLKSAWEGFYTSFSTGPSLFSSFIDGVAGAVSTLSDLGAGATVAIGLMTALAIKVAACALAYNLKNAATERALVAESGYMATVQLSVALTWEHVKAKIAEAGATLGLVAPYAIVIGLIGGLAVALVAAITAEERHIKQLQKEAEEAKNAAAQYGRETQELNSLKQAYEEAYLTGGDLSAVQDDLIEKYPELAKEIDLTTGSLDKNIQKLDEYIQKQKEMRFQELGKQYTAEREEFAEKNGPGLLGDMSQYATKFETRKQRQNGQIVERQVVIEWTVNGVTYTDKAKAQQAAEEYADLGFKDVSTARQVAELYVDLHVDEQSKDLQSVVDVVQQYYTQLSKKDQDLFSLDPTNEKFADLNKQIESITNKVKTLTSNVKKQLGEVLALNNGLTTEKDILAASQEYADNLVSAFNNLNPDISLKDFNLLKDSMSATDFADFQSAWDTRINELVIKTRESFFKAGVTWTTAISEGLRQISPVSILEFMNGFDEIVQLQGAKAGQLYAENFMQYANGAIDLQIGDLHIDSDVIISALDDSTEAFKILHDIIMEAGDDLDGLIAQFPELEDVINALQATIDNGFGGDVDFTAVLGDEIDNFHKKVDSMVESVTKGFDSWDAARTYAASLGMTIDDLGAYYDYASNAIKFDKDAVLAHAEALRQDAEESAKAIIQTQLKNSAQLQSLNLNREEYPLLYDLAEGKANLTEATINDAIAEAAQAEATAKAAAQDAANKAVEVVAANKDAAATAMLAEVKENLNNENYAGAVAAFENASAYYADADAQAADAKAAIDEALAKAQAAQQATEYRQTLEELKGSLLVSSALQNRFADATKKSGSSSGSATKGTNALTQALEDQKDALEDVKDGLEAQKKALEANKKELEKQKDALEDQKKALEDARDALDDYNNQLMDLMKDRLERELDNAQNRVSAFFDALKDAVDELKDGADEALDKLKEIADELQEEAEQNGDDLEWQSDMVLNFYDDQIQAIQDKIDAMKDEADAMTRLQKLQEARDAYEQAKQKTRLVLIEGAGWRFRTDKEALKSAQDDYQNAQLEEQEELLQRQIDDLEKIKEQWEAVAENIGKATSELEKEKNFKDMLESLTDRELAELLAQFDLNVQENNRKNQAAQDAQANYDYQNNPDNEGTLAWQKEIWDHLVEEAEKEQDRFEQLTDANAAYQAALKQQLLDQLGTPDEGTISSVLGMANQIATENADIVNRINDTLARLEEFSIMMSMTPDEYAQYLAMQQQIENGTLESLLKGGSTFGQLENSIQNQMDLNAKIFDKEEQIKLLDGEIEKVDLQIEAIDEQIDIVQDQISELDKQIQDAKNADTRTQKSEGAATRGAIGKGAGGIVDAINSKDWSPTINVTVSGGPAAESYGDRTSKEVNGRPSRMVQEFATGGVANYTGFAKLHGHESRPELVLNNSQSAALFQFIDRLSRLHYNIPKVAAPSDYVKATSNNVDESTTFTNCRFEISTESDNFEALVLDLKRKASFKRN